MELRGRYLVLGLTVVLALVVATFLLVRQLTITSADTTIGVMALNVKSPEGVCDDPDQPTKCTLDPGTAFTLSIDSVIPPAEGYITFQTFIDYGTDLIYKKAATAADEITWPDGTAGLPLRDQTGTGLVNHAGTTGFIPPFPVSTYTGNLVELAMNCSAAPSQTVIELIPIGAGVAGSSGAVFVRPDASEVPAKPTSLTINCGEVAGDTPTPTEVEATATEVEATATSTPEGPTPTFTETPTEGPTPTFTDTPAATDTPTSTPVTPTDTPTTPPEQLLGDANRDGVVNSLDALWLLWWDAELVDFLPKPEVADVNDDGIFDAVDALFILWIEADLWP